MDFKINGTLSVKNYRGKKKKQRKLVMRNSRLKEVITAHRTNENTGTGEFVNKT